MEKIQVRELCHADDVVIFGSTEESTDTRKCTGYLKGIKQKKTEKDENLERINLKCNTEKTKTTITGNES